MIRWSDLLIPTLREAPSDAEIVSHKLLLRAGLIRKLSGGVYTFLPLGLRALRKVERIVREEMDRAGAQEVMMPALQPAEIWQQSGRYKTAAEVLFHVHDRGNREWVLGPTHEEVITTLAANEINSYRQLPKNFYQIQVKFRDEIRPRFGLMRAKEFIMKDAYSFDVSDEAAQVSYGKMFDAYTRIFKRCGLKAVAVEADTGVIGGKFSHEFMVPAVTGENEVAYCEGGGYAANVEKASSRGSLKPTPTESTGAAPEKFATPGVVTIEALQRQPYGIGGHRQIKTLVYVVESKLVIALMRGDDQLNEAKFAGKLGSNQFRAATPEEIFAALGAHPGSLGAVGVTTLPIWADESLRGAKGMATGANEDGFHLKHVEIERDVAGINWADLRTIKEGEICEATGEPLKIQRAIEVGHVFKLGTKYSEAMGSGFLDADGVRKPTVMGCYGIGVTRTMQAAIEQCNDANGVIWPAAIAPFHVHMLPINVQHEESVKVATALTNELEAKGIEVLFDDRDERPGVKFKDSDLIGFPARVSVGERSLAKGEVEIKVRATGETIMASIAEAAARIAGVLAL